MQVLAWLSRFSTIGPCPPWHTQTLLHLPKHSICSGRTPNFPRSTEACIRVLQRVSDPEESIHSLVHRVFLELWFASSNGDSTLVVTRAHQLVSNDVLVHCTIVRGSGDTRTVGNAIMYVIFLPPLRLVARICVAGHTAPAPFQLTVSSLQADVAVSIYEGTGSNIHLPLGSSHPLVAVIAQAVHPSAGHVNSRVCPPQLDFRTMLGLLHKFIVITTAYSLLSCVACDGPSTLRRPHSDTHRFTLWHLFPRYRHKNTGKAQLLPQHCWKLF